MTIRQGVKQYSCSSAVFCNKCCHTELRDLDVLAPCQATAHKADLPVFLNEAEFLS